MKRYDDEIISNKIKSDYTRPGQTAEQVFQTMLGAFKYLTIWKVTNADGECYVVHENSEALDAFETRQEADDFANAWFNTRLGL